MLKRDNFHSRMTFHATKRCQQRGIRKCILELVLAEYDRDYHAGAGARALSISKHRLCELAKEGVSPALLDQAATTVLLESEDGAVVTVINRRTWFARFHYGAERLGHRGAQKRRGARGRRAIR